MNNFFKVEKVEGMSTILKIDKSDIQENKNYQDLLKFLGLARTTKNYMIESLFRRYANYFFCAGKLIPELQIDIESSYIREKTLEIYYKSIKIIPGRENVLDGYVPTLNLTLDQDNIIVEGNLRRDGDWRLSVLEDLLARTDIKDSDGINSPKIEFLRSDCKALIKVVSVDKIPRIIEDLRKLYNQLGESRLDCLSNLKEDCNQRISEPSKIKLLEEYNNMLDLLALKEL